MNNQGIGGAGGRLHAVQQRLAEGHGSQCGFCTPGIGEQTIPDVYDIFIQRANITLDAILSFCSYEHVHFAEEQARAQHGGHRHLLPGEAKILFRQVNINICSRKY